MIITPVDERVCGLLQDLRTLHIALSMTLRQVRSGDKTLDAETMEALLTMVEGTPFGHEERGICDTVDALEEELEAYYDIPVTDFRNGGADDEDEDSDEELEDESDEETLG